MAGAEGKPAITVGYWGTRGLGAPLRMMLMYTNTTFHNECYDAFFTPEGIWNKDAWFDKKPALMERSPLMNLPYVIDGDLVIAQSNACMSHLGRKLGLWGDSEAEVTVCEQLLCELMDLRNAMIGFVYSSVEDEAVPAKAAALLKGQSCEGGSLWKLEQVLAANKAGGGFFFVSDHATAPDFHAWEMLDQFVALAVYVSYGDILGNYPHLAAFHTKFAQLPGMAKYLASPLHKKLPFNNKRGVFASAPGGAKFVVGQEVDWHGLSGTY